MISAKDSRDLDIDRVARFPNLVGKTIAGVVVSKGRHPRVELHLVFTDETTCELYSEADIDGTSQVHPGTMDRVLARCRRDGRSVRATSAAIDLSDGAS
ncbi:MAG: hypothetical protein ACREOK_07885 [Gemmatimonadaceae bacterium]